ncbi:MAG: MFS transporter [Anaerolineae bacterium]|nr:MFS transporter [Anaerolineae bacterium]
MTDQQSLRRQMEANLPWNFSVNLVDGTFYSLGLNLVSQATIMPLLVSELTSSKIAIGLIPATYNLSYLLPQLLTASYSEGLRYKKPFVIFLGSLGERVPYLLIGLAVWGLAQRAPMAALVAFYLLWATTAASNGIVTPAWYSMIAKVIPVRRRGLWSGLGRSLGALLGIAGAVLAARILESWPFPSNYGLCFALAFVSVMVSWVGLALTREPASPIVKPRFGQRHYLRQIPALLRRDGNYVRYLVGRSVANLGAMAGGFFMVYGKENVPGALEQVGALTAILVGSQAVMNLLWGVVADRVGHKVVLCGAALSMALAVAAAWVGSSAGWLWAAFALLGLSLSADYVSRMNIILEFCAPEDQPTYIGLTNTLLAPGMLAPVIAGWLATRAGYRGMFSVAIALSLLGGALLAFWVREPRSVVELGRP